MLLNYAVRPGKAAYRPDCGALRLLDFEVLDIKKIVDAVLALDEVEHDFLDPHRIGPLQEAHQLARDTLVVAQTLPGYARNLEASFIFLNQRCPLLHGHLVVVLGVFLYENVVAHFEAVIRLVLLVVLGVVDQPRDAGFLARGIDVLLQNRIFLQT